MKKFTILAVILSASMLFACSVPDAGGDDLGAGQSDDAQKTEDKSGDSASEKEKVDAITQTRIKSKNRAKKERAFLPAVLFD